MKHLLLLLLAFTLYTCHKPDPVAPERLEGHWLRILPEHPEWNYDFQDHLLTQYIIDFGDTITLLQFPYATRGDTVLIGGDPQNEPRVLLFNFICDSVANVRDISPGVLISPVMYFRKSQW